MNMNRQKTFVIALGGNSILRANEKGMISEQYSNLWKTGKQLLELLASENRIVITHGNGPQVGNLLLALESARDVVPPIPLELCVAATGGFMGCMIQNTLANCLRGAKLRHNITTVITQVIVDEGDPAFKNPTKPIGPFYDLQDAEKLRRELGWVMIEDSGRGYRRVVPSPRPVQIQQARIIRSMLATGEIVIANGGGGVAVVRERDGSLRSTEAVIDKDYASSRLAIEIDADCLLILTTVEKVFRDFGLPSQIAVDHLSLAEANELLAEGQFGTGSMEPKIRAAIDFLQERDKSAQLPPIFPEREVIITLPETAMMALQGKTGTRITR
jgi:carbamate kinase